MAPQPRDKGHPDGAPPGAKAPPVPGDKYAYDADAKAKEREEADITIGGRKFRRVKKSWDVTRELRKLLRAQERAGDKVMRLEAQKDALTEKIRGVRDLDSGGWVSYPLDDEEKIAEVEQEVEGLDEQVDQLSEDSDNAAYSMIRLLLRDPEAKDDVEPKPSEEFLKKELDAAEAGDLVRLLTSGAEPDPTPATPST